MTREEMVALIKGFTEAVEARDIGSEDAAEYITEIFDRYEAEQWKPASEPPSAAGVYIVTYTDKPEAVEMDHFDGAKWSTAEFVPVALWRELPAPPKEVPNG